MTRTVFYLCRIFLKNLEDLYSFSKVERCFSRLKHFLADSAYNLQSPPYLCVKFKQRDQVHNRSTRNNDNLGIPKFQTSTEQTTFKCRCTKMWNDLDKGIKLIRNFHSFKIKIKAEIMKKHSLLLKHLSTIIRTIFIIHGLSLAIIVLVYRFKIVIVDKYLTIVPINYIIVIIVK